MASRPSPATAPRRRSWRSAVLGALATLAGGAALAGDIDRPLSGTWAAVPAGDLARRLAAEAGLPIVIDRRVDPTRPVSLEADDEPLASIVARLAAAATARAVALQATIRILPEDRAALTAAAEIRRQRDVAALPAAVRSRALATAPWSWKDGAVPRALLHDAATEAGFALDGLDRLPHDHFRGLTLPPLTLADRLDLILGQFDRRVDWSGVTGTSAGEATRLPTVPLADGLDPAGRDKPRRSALAPRPPAAGITGVRDPGRDRFTLRAEAPLEELLAVVARRTGLALMLDPERLVAAGVKPAAIVKVEVRDATRAELLDAITAPLGVTWRVSGTRLEVPAPE